MADSYTRGRVGLCCPKHPGADIRHQTPAILAPVVVCALVVFVFALLFSLRILLSFRFACFAFMFPFLLMFVFCFRSAFNVFMRSLCVFAASSLFLFVLCFWFRLSALVLRVVAVMFSFYVC